MLFPWYFLHSFFSYLFCICNTSWWYLNTTEVTDPIYIFVHNPYFTAKPRQKRVISFMRILSWYTVIVQNFVQIINQCKKWLTDKVYSQTDRRTLWILYTPKTVQKANTFIKKWFSKLLSIDSKLLRNDGLHMMAYIFVCYRITLNTPVCGNKVDLTLKNTHNIVAITCKFVNNFYL